MCAETINKNVIDHTALIRGSAAQSNIDLEKYRDEVRKELAESKESQQAKETGNQILFDFNI